MHIVGGGQEGHGFSMVFTMEVKVDGGTSLVVQWLRICLPMQGTLVQSLVQEDPPCRGATKLRAAATQAQASCGPYSATGEATTTRSPCTATRACPTPGN